MSIKLTSKQIQALTSLISVKISEEIRKRYEQEFQEWLKTNEGKLHIKYTTTFGIPITRVPETVLSKFKFKRHGYSPSFNKIHNYIVLKTINSVDENFDISAFIQEIADHFIKELENNE